jgi:glycosyltransferase involved in cell wall biosynthesis
MKSIYLGADVCVNSSRYESFGLVTAEAMSYSLPCVGFDDCPGTNELIKDGETGILIKNNLNRSSALASGLMRLLSDSLLRERLGKAGNIFISSNHCERKVLSLWEQLFHDIVEIKK